MLREVQSQQPARKGCGERIDYHEVRAGHGRIRLRSTMSSSSSDSDSLEIDLASLSAVSALARAWRDAHDEGSLHLDVTPGLFATATGNSETAANSRGTEPGVASRAVNAAPSPRLDSFIKRGGKHSSEITAAPQKLTDAVQGTQTAAHLCAANLKKATQALDVFIASIGGETDDVEETISKNRNVSRFDRIPTGVLLTALPFGKTPKTVEQWMWLTVAVLESLELEQKVVSEISNYLERGDSNQEDVAAENMKKIDAEKFSLYEREKLAGCAEVWKARAFVDETLLQALVEAEE